MPQERDSGQGDPPEQPAAAPPTRKRTRIIHRLALAQALLLVIMVLVALPIAFRSMDATLWDRQGRALYAFPSGELVPDNDENLLSADLSFLNIAAVDLDEDTGSVTLAISGHRVCSDLCPRTEFTLFSMADDAHVRRALPPSASITLLPDETVFTHTLELPIRGQPSLYPFDNYDLWLGLAGTVESGATTTRLTAPLLSGHAVITTQNQLHDFMLVTPAQIDPERIRAVTDPYDFIGVQEMNFDRPAHLKILTVMLVLLIAASAIIAVAMRQLSDLVIGVGSLILAIWGVRSVLVPTPLPVVTSVDLALSVVILFVLLGLSLRAAHYFRLQSELPPLPRFHRMRGKVERGNGGNENDT